MALVDSDYFSVIMVVDPADQALAQRVARGFLGFNTQLAVAASPDTVAKIAGVHTRVNRGSRAFQFYRAVQQGDLSADDLGDDVTAQDVTDFLAAAILRYHRIQTEDDPAEPLHNQLVNKAGTGIFNAREHWASEITDAGFVRYVEPEPAPDNWYVTRAQVEALTPTMTKAQMLDALVPRWNE